MAIAGYTAVVPRLMSGFNLNMEDCVSIGNYLESIDFYKHCKSMASLGKNEEKDNEAIGETKKVGRKPIGDDLENDNTEISISQGNNVSDIKEFVNKSKCLKCGELIESGEFLCDDCLEEEYEIRLQEVMYSEKQYNLQE